MSNRTRSYLHLEELLLHYNERCHHIRQRLAEFASVNPREYYWELAYCLLTPQSSAMHATHAVKVLRMAEESGSPLNTAAVLRNRQWYIRFHNVGLGAHRVRAGVALAALRSAAGLRERSGPTLHRRGALEHARAADQRAAAQGARARTRQGPHRSIAAVRADGGSLVIHYTDGIVHVLVPTEDGLVALFVARGAGARPVVSKVQEAESALDALTRLGRGES